VVVVLHFKNSLILLNFTVLWDFVIIYITKFRRFCTP